MRKTIGILYICTGPYVLFWEDFYRSFEKYFLPEFDKKYFVFTDKNEIYGENFENVERFLLQAQPWPLITLLRFHTFLSIESKLVQCDYLMFSNANIVCCTTITPEEFLPRIENGEKLFVTKHPGYYMKKNFEFPYDRNKYSLAYIPWNCGSDYVIGAMFGGTSKAFISMSKTLRARIDEDLKKNIVAKWHDESHLNRYIIGRTDIRFLHPKYCYPVGMNVDYEKKISGVDKQEKFDVKAFKGQYDYNKPFIFLFIKRIKTSITIRMHIIRDIILRRKIQVLLDDE